MRKLVTAAVIIAFAASLSACAWMHHGDMAKGDAAASSSSSSTSSPTM